MARPANKRPTVNYQALIPVEFGEKLDKWTKAHHSTRPKTLLYLAAKAGIITKDELLEALGVPNPDVT